jgi:hypothetical protein
MSRSCEMYVGNFPYSLFASSGIIDAVSGQAVIVRNGTAQHCAYSPQPPRGPSTSATMRRSLANAPRTALGHDIDGRIMTLQVDGDESKNTGIRATVSWVWCVKACL